MRRINDTLKRGLALLLLLLVGLTATKDLHAGTIVDRKIAQFGLEIGAECVNWARGDWPWPMRGGWRTCIGHRYFFQQHGFFLKVDGPDNVEATIRSTLEQAAVVSATAAVATGLAVPTPDPASRVGAALTAAKIAFVGFLTERGLEHLISQYSVTVRHQRLE